MVPSSNLVWENAPQKYSKKTGFSMFFSRNNLGCFSNQLYYVVAIIIDRGSLPFEQNGPKEDIDDLGVVVRICPL